MLMGEFNHTIDDKLRMIIPSKFREELGDDVIVTRGLEKCLFIYSKTGWDKITKKLNTLPFTKKDARNFTRLFLSGATLCSFDKQGRIKLVKHLCDYANIKKECVVIGVNDRVEVWAKEDWDKYYEEQEQTLSDAAEKLFETDIDL